MGRAGAPHGNPPVTEVTGSNESGTQTTYGHAPLRDGAKEGEAVNRFRVWLDRPLPGRHCVLGWLLATALFLGLVTLLGGPTDNDSGESLYSTWAIAHGQLSCTYPPVTLQLGYQFLPEYRPGPHVPPLWPLISGGVAALTGIGHRIAFPSTHALGQNCAVAYQTMFQWAHSTRSLWPTLGIGYLSWFGLLAGVVAIVRASGRGRKSWEVLGVLLLGLLPIVWMPVLDEFHPQDLLAMGLVLGGIACVERKYWAWAGALLGLALATQQFALLVFAPLFVLAPSARRWRLAIAAAAAWFLCGLPFFATNLGASWSALVFGTGNWTTFGGTVLWETGLHGHSMLFASRVLPIVLALAMAVWVRWRLGEKVLEPIVLLSFLATTLSLRLVFEQGLFGYKFLALAVMLLVLYLVGGVPSGPLVVWIVLVSLAWNPIPWGLAFNARGWGYDAVVVLPVVLFGVALVVIAWDAWHRRVRWYLVAGLAVALLAFAHWPFWVVSPPRALLPKWLWQVILLPTGIALAASPFVTAIRHSQPNKNDGVRPEDVELKLA